MGNSQQVEMTPEIKAILDAGKVELLAAKMESQKAERELAQKRRAEHEANRIKQERKVKAAQNALQLIVNYRLLKQLFNFFGI